MAAAMSITLGEDMRKSHLVQLGSSLIVIVATLACNLPLQGGGTPTGDSVSPTAFSRPSPTAAGVVPRNTDGAETVLVPGGTFSYTTPTTCDPVPGCPWDKQTNTCVAD